MTTRSISNDATLVRTFRFEVALQLSAGTGGAAGDAFADGSFQECSGLQVELDVQDYFEGGRNDAVVRRAGRARYQPLVLKRGMFHIASGQANSDLWAWLQSIASGEYPIRRYDGVIEVKTADNTDTVAEWTFERGIPLRVVGPTLNAQTGEVAIEELQIAHEGLRLATR